MIKKLLPVGGLLLGLGGGGAAAYFLNPPDDVEHVENAALAHHDDADKAVAAPAQTETPQKDTELVKLPNQFVVPVIFNNRVRAMVILTVALEVNKGTGDQVRTLEPKLRDQFLDELFDLAARDGFRDELISRRTLSLVKIALTEKARSVLGQDGAMVLITDMARQDLG